MRLLRSLDSKSGSFSTKNLLQTRSIVSDPSDPQHLRLRIIILTVLVIVFGLLPALWKIIKELNRLIAYRQRWLELRCEGKQMGWLSAREAPGFAGWGEKRFKDFVIKSGLSSGMQNSGLTRNGNKSKNGQTSNQDDPNQDEKDALQVDIQSIFSIWCVSFFISWLSKGPECLSVTPNTWPCSLMNVTRFWRTWRLRRPDIYRPSASRHQTLLSPTTSLLHPKILTDPTLVIHSLSSPLKCVPFSSLFLH
jgi:hypothetical protein